MCHTTFLAFWTHDMFTVLIFALSLFFFFWNRVFYSYSYYIASLSLMLNSYFFSIHTVSIFIFSQQIFTLLFFFFFSPSFTYESLHRLGNFFSFFSNARTPIRLFSLNFLLLLMCTTGYYLDLLITRTNLTWINFYIDRVDHVIPISIWTFESTKSSRVKVETKNWIVKV